MIVVDSSVWIDFLNGRNAPHVRRLRASGLAVATGNFGARMQVTLTNDGPATFILET